MANSRAIHELTPPNSDALRLQFDVGIVTVIGPELRAMQRMFGADDVGNRFIDRNEPFWRATIPCHFRAAPINVVISCLGHAGEEAAAAAATKLIERFHPALMLLCGIAAGRREKIKIGDIAVSRSIVDHSTEVALPGKSEPRIWAPKPPHASRQMFVTYEFHQAEVAAEVGKWLPLPLTPPAGQEVEYQKHVAMMPELHDCAIASADVLLRDPEVLEELSKNVNQGIRIGEMEAGGFATGCEDRTPATAWYVARGVSDFGDKFKNDDFHKFAALSAAAFARQFVAQAYDPRLFVGAPIEDPAIGKMARLSDIALADAAFVSDARPEVGEINLSDLYIPRTVETEIRSLLGKADHTRPVFVVGDAGHGKTSLLWQIAREQAQRRTVFFLKASSIDLLGQEGQGPRLATTELIRACEAAPIKGSQRPLLCLDTLDLLVRDEGHRDALLYALADLEMQGIRVVATCRPQEFELLLPKEVTRIELKNYNDEELRAAVQRHVERFYWNKAEPQWQSHLDRISEAVSAGRPIREVCSNPLALRMLFVLYAPHRVPLEINVFALYSRFWDARVRRDDRAGTVAASAPIDLQGAAGLLAIAMLSEGLPLLRINAAERLLQLTGAPIGALQLLLTRGILQWSGQDHIEFFHQTFFEHAAARGLRARDNGSFAAVFEAQVIGDSNDLLLAPVHEQWLLLTLNDGLRAEVARVEQQVVRLLTSRSMHHQYSAFYVFTFSAQPMPAVAQELLSLLSRCSVEVGARFLALLPNRAAHDAEQIFAEIRAVWGQHRWGLIVHAFELLERLAGLYPRETRDFLAENRRAEEAVTKHGDDAHSVYWPIMRVVDRLTDFDPSWCWKLVKLLLRRVTTSAVRTDFLSYAVDVACRLAPQLPAADFETFFHSERVKRTRSSVLQVFGRVQLTIWRGRALSLTQILQQIKDTDEADLNLALAGLAAEIKETGVGSNSAAVLAAFEAEAEIARRWFWGRVFWRSILVPATSEIPAVRPLWTALGARVAAWSEKFSEPEIYVWLDILTEVMSEIECVPEMFLTVFSDPVFSRIEFWTKCRALGKVSVPAAFSGVLGARALIDEYASGVRSRPKDIAEPIVVSLSIQAAWSAEARQALLGITLSWKDYDAANRALDAFVAANDTAQIPEAARMQLKLLCETQLRPRGMAPELAQLQVANHLMALGWMDPEPWEALSAEIEANGNTRRFNLLSKRVIIGCQHGKYDVPKVCRDASRLERAFKEKQLKPWRNAILSAIAESGASDLEVLRYAFELATLADSNIERMALFLRCVHKAAAIDPTLTLTWVRELLLSKPVKGLGRSSAFALGHKLQTPFLGLINRCTRAQRESFYPLLHEFHPAITTSLLHVLWGFAPEEIRLTIERLAADEKVDDFVRAMVLKRKRTRESFSDTRSYPWVVALLPNSGG